MPGGRAEPGDDQDVAGLVVVLHGHERGRRGVQVGDDDVQVPRQRRDDLPGHAEHVASLLKAPEQQAGLHDRADLVQAELEFSDHAEVAAAAADRPEQVGVLVRGGPADLPAGGDHLGGDEVVDAQPGLAGQPPHAPAEREPADTGVTDNTGRHGQAIGLRGGVEAGQQRTATGPCPFRLRVDADPVELAEVDHQTAVGDRGARHAVRAAPHRDLQAVGGGEGDRRGHVGWRRAPGDHRRVSVNAGVPHPASLVVSGIRRADHRPVHCRSQRAGGSAHRVCHEPSPWSGCICPYQGAGSAGAAHGCCAPIVMPALSAAGPAGRAPPGRRRPS